MLAIEQDFPLVDLSGFFLDRNGTRSSWPAGSNEPENGPAFGLLY